MAGPNLALNTRDVTIQPVHVYFYYVCIYDPEMAVDSLRTRMLISAFDHRAIRQNQWR